MAAVADPGAGAVPARRPPAAAPQGPARLTFGVRQHDRPRPAEPLTARWAAKVGRRPLPWAIGAALVMLLLALPALDMRTWPQDPCSQSSDLTTRKAYDLVTDEFGAGSNGPFMFVVDRDQVSDAADRRPGPGARRPRRHRRGHRARRPRPTARSRSSTRSRRSARPTSAPPTWSSRPRARCPAGVEVTGNTPLFADIAELLAEPALAGHRLRGRRLDAAAGDGVPLGRDPDQGGGDEPAEHRRGVRRADRGLPVGLGHRAARPRPRRAGLELGADPDVRHPVRPVHGLRGVPAVPDPRGLARAPATRTAASSAACPSTGRVISSAAAIMVAVFLGFATEVDVVVKMLGVGMAVAILLDATVVRMVLVPATMSLLGRWNWWVPALARPRAARRPRRGHRRASSVGSPRRPARRDRRAPARRHPLRGAPS